MGHLRGFLRYITPALIHSSEPAVFGLGMAGRVLAAASPHPRMILVEAYVAISCQRCEEIVSVVGPGASTIFRARIPRSFRARPIDRIPKRDLCPWC